MSNLTEDQKNIFWPDGSVNTADTEVQEMMKAGLHIGHKSSKTHPKMVSFIYTNRNGIAIFDLIKTKEKLDVADTYLKDLYAQGKTVLFVGTKPSVQNLIKHLYEEYDVPVVFERWIGGTLTNFKVILGRIQELERLLKEKSEGGFQKYTKKEVMKKEEEIKHLEKTFGGIRKLRRLPDALFLADIDENDLAVKEALRVHIPTIAVTDSNTDPSVVDFPIPTNDTSISVLMYILNKIQKAIKEGRKEAEKKLKEKEAVAATT